MQPVYAKEREDGKEGWIFGLDRSDYEKVRQGYACGNCLEEFQIGGSPVSLPKCSLCGEPTAISDIEATIQSTPEEWTEYLKYKKAKMEEPRGSQRRR